MYIYGYLRMRTQPRLKNTFLWVFFYLKGSVHSDKNDLSSWKYVPNKGYVEQDAFLDFADISS